MDVEDNGNNEPRPSINWVSIAGVAAGLGLVAGSAVGIKLNEVNDEVYTEDRTCYDSGTTLFGAMQRDPIQWVACGIDQLTE